MSGLLRMQPCLQQQLERLFYFWLLLCLRFDSGAACGVEEQQHQGDKLILCRACGHELAYAADIHHVPSHLALSSCNDTLIGDKRVNVQLFENPQGHRFEVITLRKANVSKHWPADERFSWYPGYSWTVATCPRCKTHLGWAFQPSDWPETITRKKFEESDQTFVALITHRLLREDFASSLLVTPKSFMS